MPGELPIPTKCPVCGAELVRWVQVIHMVRTVRRDRWCVTFAAQ